jgi:hypothetical protein
MRNIKFSLFLLGAALAGSLQALPANAQATRTWVSGVGDDANPCSRTAPCKTFAGAISKTAPAGEINCLDPGGFGAVTITKSIIISCEAGTAGVLVSGTNGIVVQAAPADIVYLRGLDIEGLTTGLSGILFVSGGALHLEKSLIRGFNSGAATGISFNPTGTAELYVSDTVVADNGTGLTGAGIWVMPSGGGSANVVLDRVRAEHNTFGMVADSTASTAAGVVTSITDSVSAGNSSLGIKSFTTAGHPPVRMMVNRTTVVNNGVVGVNAEGPNAYLFIGSSVVAGNGQGALVANGGTLGSYQNNQINENITADGTPIPSPGLN